MLCFSNPAQSQPPRITIDFGIAVRLERRRAGPVAERIDTDRLASTARGQGEAEQNAVVAERDRLAALDMERGQAAEAGGVAAQHPAVQIKQAAEPPPSRIALVERDRREAQHRHRGARRRRVGRGGDIGRERGEGQQQEGRAPGPGPPELFRKTPQNHERRLTVTFRAGSSDGVQKGVMSQAGAIMDPASGQKDKGAFIMLKKIIISAAAAATALTALPAAAEAQSRYGYSNRYDNGSYGQAYGRGYTQNRYYAQGYNRGYERPTAIATIATITGAAAAPPARSSARSPAA